MALGRSMVLDSGGYETQDNSQTSNRTLRAECGYQKYTRKVPKNSFHKALNWQINGNVIKMLP